MRELLTKIGAQLFIGELFTARFWRTLMHSRTCTKTSCETKRTVVFVATCIEKL